MPSARTDEQHSRFVFEGVNASGGGVGVGDFSAGGISEVALSFGEVGPGGGGAVFEVGHVDVGSGIKTVDDHFAVDGTDDDDDN